MTKPHYHGHRQRLRRRFEKHGLDGLADYEVMELLLTLAIPRADVKAPAKELLARFGSVRGVLDAPAAALSSVRGIGAVAPVALRIIRAAVTLYLLQAAGGRDALRDPKRIADFWRLRIGGLSHEVFEVAYLDSGRRLLREGVERLQTGTVDRPWCILAPSSKRHSGGAPPRSCSPTTIRTAEWNPVKPTASSPGRSVSPATR